MHTSNSKGVCKSFNRIGRITEISDYKSLNTRYEIRIRNNLRLFHRLFRLRRFVFLRYQRSLGCRRIRWKFE